MDIHKYLREGGNPDELDQHLMDLDSTFRFKCRRCGKCCKNQDMKMSRNVQSGNTQNLNC